VSAPSIPTRSQRGPLPPPARERLPSGYLIASEGLCFHSSSGEIGALFASPCLPWTSGSFHDGTGCINAMVEGETCGRTSRCSYCPFFQAMTETITSGHSVGPFLLQRTFLMHGRYTEMTVRVSTRFLGMRGQRLAFADLEDVTKIPANGDPAKTQPDEGQSIGVSKCTWHSDTRRRSTSGRTP